MSAVTDTYLTSHVPATTDVYTLSLHDALPICPRRGGDSPQSARHRARALGGGPGGARGRAAPRGAARNARALGGAGAPAHRRPAGQRAPRRRGTHGARHAHLRVGPARAERAERARAPAAPPTQT